MCDVPLVPLKPEVVRRLVPLLDLVRQQVDAPTGPEYASRALYELMSVLRHEFHEEAHLRWLKVMREAGQSET